MKNKDFNYLKVLLCLGLIFQIIALVNKLFTFEEGEFVNYKVLKVKVFFSFLLIGGLFLFVNLRSDNSICSEKMLEVKDEISCSYSDKLIN